MSHNDSEFLLQRLQELKAWQFEQEQRLLREQEHQMDTIYLASQTEDRPDEDDNASTIDQDISSLASFVDVPDPSAPPAWAQAPSPAQSESVVTVNGAKAAHDEVPIANKPKTFEELLDEQLKANDDAVQTPETVPSRQTSSAKAFLRRGSGLARYGGVSGSPNGLVRRRIHSSGKLQTRARSQTSLNKTPSTPSSMKTSASCSKLNAKQPLKPVLKKESLKLKPKPETTELRKPATNGNVGTYDSVELSFMEKLATANQSHKKEMEDLAMFEMLEEAACDSSFCSSSSTVKKLIENQLPVKQTSTPKTERFVKNDGLTPKNLNEELKAEENLVKDIQAFLTSKGATVVQQQPEEDENEEDDDADTLKDFASDDMSNQEESSDDWSDVDEDCLNKNNNKQKNVRFSKPEEFSPPRIPKNSPSYLIWSIFTKDREERMRKRMENKTNKKVEEKVDNFESTLLNAKLAELEKEIQHFRKENTNLQTARRKLNGEKKQLAKDIEEFEKNRETERKRMEEEKKRLRRDKMLLEKSQKEKRSNLDRKAQEEIDDLQAKV